MTLDARSSLDARVEALTLRLLALGDALLTRIERGRHPCGTTILALARSLPATLQARDARRRPRHGTARRGSRGRSLGHFRQHAAGRRRRCGRRCGRRRRGTGTTRLWPPQGKEHDPNGPGRLAAPWKSRAAAHADPTGHHAPACSITRNRRQHVCRDESRLRSEPGHLHLLSSQIRRMIPSARLATENKVAPATAITASAVLLLIIGFEWLAEAATSSPLYLAAATTLCHRLGRALLEPASAARHLGYRLGNGRRDRAARRWRTSGWRRRDRGARRRCCPCCRCADRARTGHGDERGTRQHRAGHAAPNELRHLTTIASR